MRPGLGAGRVSRLSTKLGGASRSQAVGAPAQGQAASQFAVSCWNAPAQTMVSKTVRRGRKTTRVSAVFWDIALTVRSLRSILDTVICFDSCVASTAFETGSRTACSVCGLPAVDLLPRDCRRCRDYRVWNQVLSDPHNPDRLRRAASVWIGFGCCAQAGWVQSGGNTRQVQTRRLRKRDYQKSPCYRP